MGVSTKMKRTGSIALLALLALGSAVAAVAQSNRKQPDTDICVIQNPTTPDELEAGCFKSIQAAINAAQPGNVIEILDVAVYAEQVTIDGRDGPSPWAGVTSGKNGITLRYVPRTNAAFSTHDRPTIRYRDITNIHPSNDTEAKQESELTGAGNFETCGALRVLRAKGITIEGIAVDGGGAFVFGNDRVWCKNNGSTCDELVHGNAAITLAVAGRVTIRDCDLRNAYFGINVKDRNTGGVFGNPNPSDNDNTVPLSGFGNAGGHLFEYNRIHDNSVGVFVESAWDLGSSIRYNLIYNNTQKTTKPSTLSGDNWDKVNAAAFMFKDNYLTPIAIYNNTLYDNTANFMGHWQPGGQHLIFNNIFSKSTPSNNGNAQNHMSLDGKFPYRMNNCVFSAPSVYRDGNGIRGQYQSNYNCSNTMAPGGYFVAAVQLPGFTALTGRQITLSICNTPGTPSGTQGQVIVTPGTSITGFTQPAGTISADAGLRWLQTEGATVTEGLNQGQSFTLAPLFRSLTATSADFLVPDWGEAAVDDYIKNKGWTTAGMRTSDGQPADLGAIPSSGGRLTTIARIIPTNVVMLNTAGTSGSANFRLSVEKGTFNNPKIKMLRWIAPVPANCQGDQNGCNGKDWPGDIDPVPQTSIRNITGTLPNVQVGNNSGLTFNTNATGTVPRYGFFEIIIEGTDAAGNPVTSDVGFLPYRQLEYVIDITVRSAPGTTGAALKEVTAGTPYYVTFRPTRRDGGAVTYDLNEATYSLLSEPPTWMRRVANDEPLTGDTRVPANGQTYQVYFTQAGEETISAAGIYTGQGNRLVFLGTLDIVVNPGAPYKAVFINPLPERLLAGAPPPTINRGGAGLPVTVEVQDKFGNATNSAVPVALQSLQPDTGTITPATATTSAATGQVEARATVVGGHSGSTFKLTAAYNPTAGEKGPPDTLLLRIGRTLDFLRIFYSDAGPDTNAVVNQDVKIDEMFGTWVQVTVKAIEGDTVQTTRTQAIVVERSDEPYDGLIFAATSGGTPTNTFTMTNGIAKFWVSAESTYPSSISDAMITVTAVDGTIAPGDRGDINFTKPESNVLRAEVFGNGEGRPNRVDVYFATGGGGGLGTDIKVPANISFRWPSLTDDAITLPVTSAMYTVGDTVLSVAITGAQLASLPTGFTEPVGNRMLVVLNYAAGDGDPNGDFDVLDKIGPVISSDQDMSATRGGASPVITENLDPRNTPDVIEITLSEGITDEMYLRPIMYSTDGTGSGVALNVTGIAASGAAYSVTVSPGVDGVVPVEGGWIKIGSPTQLTDRSGNGVLNDNRWVQLVGKQVAPGSTEAWYTSDPATGRPDIAAVTFNKPANFQRWFGSAGASVRIGGTAVTANVGDYMTSEGNTLRMDLKVAVPSIGDMDKGAPIKTSGILDIVFGFSNDASGTDGERWENLPVMARDMAAPVLAAGAELRMGGLMENDDLAPDTLIVIYSENLSDEAESALTSPQRPVNLELWRNGAVLTPPCQPVLRDAVPTSASGFRRITYIVESLPCEVQQRGDSVRIRVEENLADAQGNVQSSPLNLAQPLTVKPSPIRWSVRVKNNPARAGVSNPTRIVLTPGAKGGTLRTDATFIVFDNMGSVVTTEAKKFGQNVGDPKEVEWEWDGNNQKGRHAGTGAYVLKVICDAQEFGADGVTPLGPKQKYVATRTIGLIRGGK